MVTVPRRTRFTKSRARRDLACVQQIADMRAIGSVMRASKVKASANRCCPGAVSFGVALHS
jgi:hypothetical protein